jgi:hypothetical protein
LQFLAIQNSRLFLGNEIVLHEASDCCLRIPFLAICFSKPTSLHWTQGPKRRIEIKKKCDVDMGQGAVEDYLPLPTIAFDQKAELRIILF